MRIWRCPVQAIIRTSNLILLTYFIDIAFLDLIDCPLPSPPKKRLKERVQTSPQEMGEF